MQTQKILECCFTGLIKIKCKITGLHKLRDKYSDFTDSYLSEYIKDQKYALQCQHCGIVKIKDVDDKHKTLDTDQLFERLNVIQYKSKLALVENDENYLGKMLSDHVVYDYQYSSINSILEKPISVEVWVQVPNMHNYLINQTIKKNFDTVNSEIYHKSELVEQHSSYL